MDPSVATFFEKSLALKTILLRFSRGLKIHIGRFRGVVELKTPTAVC